MSAEVGVLLLPLLAAPVLAAGLAAGVGLLAVAAGDKLAERQQRAWNASDRLAQAVAEHDLLRGRIERERARFGELISPLAALARPGAVGADVERANAIGAHIDAQVAAAERRFRAEVAAARAGRIMADVAAAIARMAPPPSTPDRPAPAVAAQPSAELRASLERVLRRIDGAVPPKQSAVLEQRAADALRVASEATALRLLDDLRYSVERANTEAGGRRTALRELSRRVGGFSGPAIDDIRARLLAAHDEPEPDLPALAHAVDAAIETTLAPVVRDYTRRALRESLQEIGCTVEEDFEVALGRDGLAHVQGQGWDDLAVRVRARDDNGYRFNLVAPRDAEEPDLAAVEHRWCGAVDQLMTALAARGVGVETTHRSEEGDPHVQYVDPARFPFERRHRDGRRRADEQRRQRELPR
ncbi:hypothetical protein [Dactylosporangium sp. NPDC051541]|uniref:hypothetical protein n=1 Tax=Dactylosporangium sp. NPDC051541 TaxID=3363977 RepID=UPI0037A7A3BE